MRIDLSNGRGDDVLLQRVLFFLPVGHQAVVIAVGPERICDVRRMCQVTLNGLADDLVPALSRVAGDGVKPCEQVIGQVEGHLIGSWVHVRHRRGERF